MLDPGNKFCSETQRYFGPHEDPGTETHCDVWSWDELRVIQVKGTAKLFPPFEDVEASVLERFADHLSPKVWAVTVDDDGLLCGISTDVEEDVTWYMPYYRFSTIPSLANCRTIAHSKLQELDRLGPGVDLSSYRDESEDKKVAFKFNPSWKPLRLNMAWNELHVLRSLPPHPNLIPFDRIVLEDVEARIIGFTTKYIDSTTLENLKLPFRFEWLQQLVDVVDFLNLELGIIHQDIAPRNLLVDPDTQKLILFDFDRAICRTGNLSDGRDDINGVVFTLYELITNDNGPSNTPHWDRDPNMVQNMPEWTCNRKLDSDVTKFRACLNEWVARRRSDGTDLSVDAPNQIKWPNAPEHPDYQVPIEHGEFENGETNWITGPRSRNDALKKGQYCFRWERPPQSRLNMVKKGERQDVNSAELTTSLDKNRSEASVL